jgi:hypothetical protein
VFRQAIILGKLCPSKLGCSSRWVGDVLDQGVPCLDVLIPAVVIDGILRGLLLVPVVGDLRVRQVGVFVGSLIILVVTYLFVGWIKAGSPLRLLSVGGFWLNLTVVFELALGRPMLVVPFAHDQPDNAERLRRLGVARTIPGHRYSAVRATAELRRLLDDPSYSQRASQVRDRMSDEDAVRVTCDALEAMLQLCTPAIRQPRTERGS